MTMMQFACAQQKEILYVGTYSQRASEGLYVYEFNREAFTFTLLQTMPEINSPNFLAIHPNGNFLYSVNLTKDSDGNNIDVITSYSIDKKNGTLTFLNQFPTYGKGACHISLDNEGKWAFVSHYTSGSISVFPVKGSGELSDSIQAISYEGSSVHRRQSEPHVHSALISPGNKHLYVADLGTDKVMIYTINSSTGKLIPAAQPWYSAIPGAGPRHFTFNSKGTFVYLAEELSNTVSVIKRNLADGSLEFVQSIKTLPVDFSAMNTVADIHLDPEEKFLYVTNRGHNSMAIFKINPDNTLEILNHEPILGNHPRNFMVDPMGSFVMVANQFTDNVPVFKRDKVTGMLSYSELSLDTPAAVCLKLLKLK
jgi:6-phosphogluconolactonase